MAHLEARSVKGPEAAPAKQASSVLASSVPSAAEREPKQGSASSHLLVVVKHEPNEHAAQAESLSVPAVIEGTIGGCGQFQIQGRAQTKAGF